LSPFRLFGPKALLSINPTLRRRIGTTAGAIVVGLVAFAFAGAADVAQKLFSHLSRSVYWAPAVLTPLGFALLALLMRRYAPGARGSGIPQVMHVARSVQDPRAQRLISPATAAWKMVLTVAALLCGASVGREGPTVQVSAAIMAAFQRLTATRLSPAMVIAGGAAGVSAAFNTPLAGVAFAIEELASAYEQRLAVIVMAAVMIAGLVSQGLEGDYIYFGGMHQALATGLAFMIAPLAGVFGGLLGALFSRSVLFFARSGSAAAIWTQRRPVAFALGCGVTVTAIGYLTHGATWGTGYDAARQMVEGHPASTWFGPAKFLSSLATAVSGIAGGIFAPSLAVGAGVGNILALAFPGSGTGPIVVLGMVGYFVGVVRAPLTGVIIVSEMTDSRSLLLPLFATALIADAISGLVCRERLYGALSRTFEPPLPPAGAAPAAAET